jgi:hypothetical protein
MPVRSLSASAGVSSPATVRGPDGGRWAIDGCIDGEVRTAAMTRA